MGTIKGDEDPLASLPTVAQTHPAWLRWLLVGFGWVMVATGIVGVFVPVMPTTIFLIAALWAFTRSSRRFQVWLWTHPTFGPPVRDWHLHGVIPVRAKVLAILLMSASFAYVTFGVAEDWRLPVLVGAILLPAAIYIVTRRSRAPGI